MAQLSFRALVVDDEAIIRQLTMRALTSEGFTCDEASDGNEALELVNRAQYDVVVTDLRMPGRQAQVLALELLQREHRPLVVILTGVIDPRITKDLLARGIDDIAYKPVNYDTFAAKVKALIDRRATPTALYGAPFQQLHKDHVIETSSETPQGSWWDRPVSISDIETKLPYVSSMLPVSHAALDVFNMTSTHVFDSQQIATAVSRDDSLARELLQFTNCSFCNPARIQVLDLSDAVARIGQQRAGELALATSALDALTAGLIPWMDVGLIWRRSLAAGIAVELLVAQGGHQRIQGGLLASAMMHELGRTILGALYTKQYEAMIEACQERGESLLQHEKRIFPESHVEVMVRLLADWDISPDICHPLKFILDEYAYLGRLAEPMRTQVELIKLGVLIGQIAVGQWKPWDWIEFPPGNLLNRLKIHSMAAIIDQTKMDLNEIRNVESPPLTTPNWQSSNTELQQRELTYCNLSLEPFDFLAPIVASMGARLIQVDKHNLASTDSLVLNCIGESSRKSLSRLHEAKVLTVYSAAEPLEESPQFGKVLPVPTSFAALRSACWNVLPDTWPCI